ncbi:MAG: YbhN family protein [Syntrophobacteraceae bacterium]
MIVLLACVCLLAFYIWRHLSDFENLTNISIYYVLLIGCFWLFPLFLQGLSLKTITIDFGIDLCFREYFSISVMTSFGNIFLPMSGGAGFRAVYLKSKYDFSYANFVSSLAGTYVVSFNVASQIALAGMAILYFQTGAFNYPVSGVFVTILLFTLWAIVSPPASLDWLPIGWLKEHLTQLLNGWHTLRRSRKTVLKLLVWTLLYIFLSAVITWLEFSAFRMKDSFGNPIGYLQSLIFVSIGSLSGLVSITPGAFGIRESLLMFSSQFLGISPAQALAVVLLDRSVGFVVVALLSTFASITLKKRLRLKAPAPS